ncbi:MAG: methyltransferase type 11 [Deltaproteobacteria bacterium RBG_16_47_11]|nr:MAG: methyltransferase type 11 [Deltaproteobacteria bacterium RBG_16_47_11]
MKLTTEDRNRIKASIRQKYAEVSVSPEGLFRYPTGRVGLEALGYASEIIRSLPEAAVSSYCGVGNPFILGQIKEGDEVLDIGCGGGVDTLAAAIIVGSTGNVVGIDMVSEMLARAKENLRETLFHNVTLLEASAEDLPFRRNSFHVVISNGVFNLIVDKARALAEVFRALKPNGRLMIADQILTGDLPDDTKSRVESWFR